MNPILPQFFYFIIQSNETWFINFEKQKLVSVDQLKNSCGGTNRRPRKTLKEWNNRSLFIIRWMDEIGMFSNSVFTSIIGGNRATIILNTISYCFCVFQGDCRTYSYVVGLSSNEQPHWKNLVYLAKLIPRICHNINRFVTISR